MAHGHDPGIVCPRATLRGRVCASRGPSRRPGGPLSAVCDRDDAGHLRGRGARRRRGPLPLQRTHQRASRDRQPERCRGRVAVDGPRAGAPPAGRNHRGDAGRVRSREAVPGNGASRDQRHVPEPVARPLRPGRLDGRRLRAERPGGDGGGSGDGRRGPGRARRGALAGGRRYDHPLEPHRPGRRLLPPLRPGRSLRGAGGARPQPRPRNRRLGAANGVCGRTAGRDARHELHRAVTDRAGHHPGAACERNGGGLGDAAVRVRRLPGSGYSGSADRSAAGGGRDQRQHGGGGRDGGGLARSGRAGGHGRAGTAGRYGPPGTAGRHGRRTRRTRRGPTGRRRGRRLGDCIRYPRRYPAAARAGRYRAGPDPHGARIRDAAGPAGGLAGTGRRGLAGRGGGARRRGGRCRNRPGGGVR